MPHKTVLNWVAVICLTLVLSSCTSMQETYQNNPKAVLGTLIGAGAGAGIAAAAGGGAGWMLGGAAIGGLLGGVVGNQLDNRDKQMATQAANQAFNNNKTGEASVWNNPDTGNSGSVTPTKTYQLANGQYCREYKQTITVGGEPQQAYGTACRQPDGTWKIQS